MQVILTTLQSCFTPLERPLNRLVSLFWQIVTPLTNCLWGDRKAKVVTEPSQTDKKAQEVAAAAAPKSPNDRVAIPPKPNTDNKTEENQYLHDKKVMLPTRIGIILKRMRKGDITPENVMLDIRHYRKELMRLHPPFTPGEFEPGSVEHLRNLFFKDLFGTQLEFRDEYSISGNLLMNGDQWVAGCTIQNGGHAVAYIYTKEGFSELDNAKEGYKVFSAKEMHDRIMQDPWCVITLLRFPIDQKRDRIPDVSNWVIPTWERNNCFFSATLVFFALYDHYSS